MNKEIITEHPFQVTFAILIVIAGLNASASYIYSSQFATLEPPTPQEQPEIEASYSNETNELELEIVEGQFTDGESNHVRLNQGDTNFTLQGYGEEKKTNYWAKNRFSLLDSEGLIRFPISEGENISFEIEDVEPVTIKTVNKGEEVTSHNIVFEDCEPQVYSSMYVMQNETSIDEPGDC